jgi:hypothetical protein
MEIGKPQRIYRVEPLRDPVPPKREPREQPQRPRTPEPSIAPAR